ncbi:hypothetical protein ACVBEH_33945, partial [Roseateles sp. GG27B]
TNDPTADGWFELDSSSVDLPGRIDSHISPYQTIEETAADKAAACVTGQVKAEDGSQPIMIVRKAVAAASTA